MSKEIPKREGQKLNGVFPSVFALAFLMVGVPFLSTLIVDGSLWFGDSSKYVSSYTRENALAGEGDFPFWVQSGDGVDSKCTSTNIVRVSRADCSANITTGYSYNQTIAAINNPTKWHMGLPHCSNSSAATGAASRCGDSGYIVTQNITSRLELDRLFPSIYVQFTNDIQYLYNSQRMGESKVDFKITISHFMREPIFAGTNIWTYGFVDEQIVIEGIETFDNHVELSNGLHRLQIEIDYSMNFVELDQLSQILDNYYNNINESFGIFMTIELNNLRTERGYAWSNVGYYNPFTQGADGNHEMYLDFVQLKRDPFNLFLRFGVVIMGVGFWGIALASTPYWDPFIKKVKK